MDIETERWKGRKKLDEAWVKEWGGWRGDLSAEGLGSRLDMALWELMKES